MDQSSACKADGSSASERIPSIYRTRNFTTVFTRVCYWSLSGVRWISFTFCLISWRSILVLSRIRVTNNSAVANSYTLHFSTAHIKSSRPAVSSPVVACSELCDCVSANKSNHPTQNP
jgi:hypothetical protein